MMSSAAKGIYIELLCVSWMAGKLPVNPEQLKRLAKAEKSEWADFEPFLDEVLPVCDGVRQNVRLEKERAKTQSYFERQQSNGSKGGRPKQNSQDNQEENPRVNPWDNPEETHGLSHGFTQTKPTGKPKQNPRDIPRVNPEETHVLTHGETIVITHNSELITQNSIPPKSPEGEATEFSTFSEFFSVFKLKYPNRKGSPNWPEAEKKLAPLWKLHAVAILAGVDGYRGMLERTGKVGSEFVKMASTWVNQKGWLDDYSEPEPVKTEPVSTTVSTDLFPAEGVDFELKYDRDLDKVIKVKPGSTEPFDEAEWRSGRAA
jgi:uncharacterized protein YdaU (DUF1376 family)